MRSAILMLAPALFLAPYAGLGQGPQMELLWPDGAPGAVGKEDVDKPALTWYRPASPNGAAVLVCPGGGYGALAMDHEGKQIGEFYNSFGVTAFVLKYRLGPRYHHPAPLDDARKAMRTIRERAGEYGIDPKRVGVMGFSAGGHLASTLSTHYQKGERPDFAVLVYPVISFTTIYTHSGSMWNLLGNPPDPTLVWNLSNELQVTPDTPPTFLFHTSGDTGVPPENSVLYYLALRRAGVKAEMHIYQEGQHGVGLAPKDPVLGTWPARLKDWLAVNGFVPGNPR
ncbi:MAG: alpha/beta hydrolase [Bryobacteraceae bacterium]